MTVLTDHAYQMKAFRRLRRRQPGYVIWYPTNRAYPGMFVARLLVTLPVCKPTRFVMTHQTLVDLRLMLPLDMDLCIPATPKAMREENVAEIWLNSAWVVERGEARQAA